MNLREMKSLVFTRLGDPAERKLPFGEVITYLNVAQLSLGNLMWDWDRTKFLAINKQTSTSGTNDYDTPGDVRQIVRVLLNSVECHQIAAEDWGAISRDTNYRAMKGQAQWFMEYEGTKPGKTRVRLAPTPDATTADAVEIWYYRRPALFHEWGVYDGVATNGSTTTIVDTAAPFNVTGSAYPNFWSNASIRLTSGTNNGISARVLTWAPSTSTFTLDVTLATAVAATHTYEIDQVSILPDYLHPLMCTWACYMGANKAGQDPAMYYAEWQNELEALRRRYIDNIKPAIAGETVGGIRAASGT